MYSEEALLRLIGRIYDAALAPERWPAFLEDLAEVVDGHVANLAHTNPQGTRITMAATARFDPQALKEYAAYYGKLDPWLRAATAGGLIRAGEIGLGNRLLHAHDVQKTEFYNDFGRRFNVNGGFSVILSVQGNVASAVSVTQRKRDFGESEVLLLRALLPHLQRALQLHDRFAGLAHQRDAAMQVVDHLPFGVVLVDVSGRPVLINRAAQRIIDRGDGIFVRRRSLVTSNPPETTTLRELLSSAAEASTGRIAPPGGTMTVGRTSSKRPLHILVSPIRARLAGLPDGASAAVAAIFLSDPDDEAMPPDEILRSFYLLTPAETRLASQLLQHRPLNEAAQRLGISVNTARTHLKRLLEKTATRRQSELLQLLGGGIAHLNGRTHL